MSIHIRSYEKRRGDWCIKTHLFSVVDFPEEGLPTRPINGSRGILDNVREREREARVSMREEEV